ncbi:MAG: hypothetical protein ACSLEN_10915 [Candidatus Malihini olakiniferum]
MEVVDTPELERQVWGSPHIVGGHNMSLACQPAMVGTKKTIEAFFKHHRKYIEENPIEVVSGTESFLGLLHEFSVRVTSYGGRTKEYVFDKHMPLL